MATLAIISAVAVGSLALAEEPATKPPTAKEWQEAWVAANEKFTAAQTPADIDAALDAFPYSLERAFPQMSLLVRAAIRVGHPEALNFALVAYRYTPLINVTSAVTNVASALKNKDGTLTRANAWTAQQNTGTDKAAFTAAELKPPAALATVVPSPQAQLDAAMAEWRQADREVMLNIAVEKIASALRAIDHDTLRQNAFVEAQRDGRKFEIK